MGVVWMLKSLWVSFSLVGLLSLVVVEPWCRSPCTWLYPFLTRFPLCRYTSGAVVSRAMSIFGLVVKLCCFSTVCRRNRSKKLFRSITTRRMSFNRHYLSNANRKGTYRHGFNAKIMIGTYFAFRRFVGVVRKLFRWPCSWFLPLSHLLICLHRCIWWQRYLSWAPAPYGLLVTTFCLVNFLQNTPLDFSRLSPTID